MLLSSLVPNRLRQKGQVQVLDEISESLLRIHSEDSTSRVVFLGINGIGERNLYGSNRMALWDVCQVHFKIDEAFVSSLEEIFDVFGLFNEGLEVDECSIDLMLIDLNECDGFLFLFEM